MNDFEKMVFEMRKSQKEYFKGGGNYWLSRAKKLEKLVDQVLDEKINPKLDV